MASTASSAPSISRRVSSPRPRSASNEPPEVSTLCSPMRNVSGRPRLRAAFSPLRRYPSDSVTPLPAASTVCAWG
ncbi:Uncharacterised protein [Bordetella pertussis]|nr:Uncharacterised protein [Bordetella pertussis]